MGNERGAAPAATGVRVLILDEDRVEGGMLAFHLRREGLIVMLMTSLDEMRDALAWAAPDVLLVDLTSRGFDARELFAVLRAAEATNHFDIVAFADRALDAELELDALRHGIVDILTKPLDARGLAERVRQRTPGARRPPDPTMPVPDGAIAGDLKQMPPLKVLELCLRHRLNARFHVPIEGDWAVVVVRQGDVIDAETATTTGRTAAITALRATAGPFVLLPLSSDADELRRDDVVRMDLATLAGEALGRAVVPPKARGLERAPIPTSPGHPVYAPPTPPPSAYAQAPARAAPAPPPKPASSFTQSRSFSPVRPAAQIDPAAHEVPRVARREPQTGPKPGPYILQHDAAIAPPAEPPTEGNPTVFEIPTDQKQLAQTTSHTTPTGPSERQAAQNPAHRAISKRLNAVTRVASDDEIGPAPTPARKRDDTLFNEEEEREDRHRREDRDARERREDTRERRRAPIHDDDEREPIAHAGALPGRTRIIVLAAAALAFTIFVAWRLAVKDSGAPAPVAMDAETRLGLALRDLDGGKRDDARRALIALAAEPSPDSAVLASLARIQIEDQRWIEAQGLLETLAERSPGDPRVWAWLGIVRAERGETQRAVEAFAKAQSVGASRTLSEKLARLMPGPKTPPANP